MKNKLRAGIVLAVLAATIAAVTLNVSAAGNSGSTKRGWGFGDPNHTHSGPPGQSNHPK